MKKQEKQMTKIAKALTLAGGLAVGVILLLIGCTKDVKQGTIPGGGKVQVSLTVGGDEPLRVVKPGANLPQTDETAVRDLWVLQYDMSTAAGRLVFCQRIEDVLQVDSRVYASVALEALEKARIVVLANAPESFSENTLSAGSPMGELDDLTFSVSSRTGAGIPSDDSGVLPMRGDSPEVNLAAGKETSLRVPLYRLVSRVKFTVENKCTSGYPRLSITEVSLCNVPVVGSYDCLREDTHSGILFPAVSGRNFSDYAPIVSADGSAEQIDCQWYMVPNSRGKGTGTTPADKTMLTAPAGQGLYCTYVSVRGQMEEAEGVEAKPVSWRVYLGENNTDDYNVWANESYAIRMNITGLPDDPDTEMGHDGFEVEITGPEGTDNTVEGWDHLYFDVGISVQITPPGETDNTVDDWYNPSEDIGTDVDIEDPDNTDDTVEDWENPSEDVGTDVGIEDPGKTDGTVDGWEHPSGDVGTGVEVEDPDQTDNTVEGWG